MTGLILLEAYLWGNRLACAKSVKMKIRTAYQLIKMIGRIWLDKENELAQQAS